MIDDSDSPCPTWIDGTLITWIDESMVKDGSRLLDEDEVGSGTVGFWAYVVSTMLGV